MTRDDLIYLGLTSIVIVIAAAMAFIVFLLVKAFIKVVILGV